MDFKPRVPKGRIGLNQQKFMTYLFAIITAGCGSMPKRPVVVDGRYFPDGKYQQSIDVNVTAPGMAKSLDFNAVLQIDPEISVLVGLGSFGITLFKIRQENHQAVEAETSIAEIRAHQEFFIKVFDLMQTIVHLERTDPRIRQSRIDLEVDGIKANVFFQSFDRAGIPVRMMIAAKGQYEVVVKTTSYDLRGK